MINELDNAKVLMISEKGHYGHIEVEGLNYKDIEVCYLAICKYDKDDIVYLFLCDENMSVEQDNDHESVDTAIAEAQRRSQAPITWNYPTLAV